MLVACLISPPVFAVTTTANIDATAGLEPLMTLTCFPVNFGVWNGVVRGNFSVQLDPHSVQPVLPPGSHASLAGGYGYSFGACLVSGSNEPDGTMVNLRVSGGYPIVGDASVYSGIEAGLSAASA